MINIYTDTDIFENRIEIIPMARLYVDMMQDICKLGILVDQSGYAHRSMAISEVKPRLDRIISSKKDEFINKYKIEYTDAIALYLDDYAKKMRLGNDYEIKVFGLARGDFLCTCTSGIIRKKGMDDEKNIPYPVLFLSIGKAVTTDRSKSYGVGGGFKFYRKTAIDGLDKCRYLDALKKDKGLQDMVHWLLDSKRFDTYEIGICNDQRVGRITIDNKRAGHPEVWNHDFGFTWFWDRFSIPWNAEERIVKQFDYLLPFFKSISTY